MANISNTFGGFHEIGSCIVCLKGLVIVQSVPFTLWD